MEKPLLIQKKYRDGCELKKQKGEVVLWSECMRRFNLTSEELKKIIDEGTCISNANVEYFIDEALTY